ncbi:TIM barrel protein [Candidatus Woesearchaeota archaeon]|nr:TIM barrel protein [Candidatus Woesearchaeota archaeon]
MGFDFSKIKVKEPGHLHFGTAGIPISTDERNTIGGIKQVKRLGLDAMELEFVHSVNLTPERAAEVYEANRSENVLLTCHGQYYINLSPLEKAKQGASRARILKAAEIARMAGAWSLTFHSGFYMGREPSIVYPIIREQLKKIADELDENSNNIWIRPETTGKGTQFGELKEILQLSQEIEQVMPCIDFGHLHARTNGKNNSPDEFRQILSSVEKSLGRKGLDNMHIHMTGIAYGEKGEKHHLNLDESDFNYKELLKVWKEFKIKGAVISESPNVEVDALMMKREFLKL